MWEGYALIRLVIVIQREQSDRRIPLSLLPVARGRGLPRRDRIGHSSQ